MGHEAALRLQGWSRSRRVIMLRRRLPQTLAVTVARADDHSDLFWTDAKPGAAIWEFAVLVTSADLEICALAQLYRDRGDSENPFDELKNQWGWAGFTTADINRCQLMARLIALIYNWWTLYGWLADPDHHHEALTMRSLLLNAVAPQTRLRVTSSHGRREHVAAALQRIAKFLTELTKIAEQFDRCRTVDLHPQLCPPKVSARTEMAAAADITASMRLLSPVESAPGAAGGRRNSRF